MTAEQAQGRHPGAGASASTPFPSGPSPSNSRRRIAARIARPAARIAAFIGLAAPATALGSPTGCSTADSRWPDPDANLAPSRAAGGVVPPDQLQPFGGAVGGWLGLSPSHFRG
jgi:hypothetical protein